MGDERFQKQCPECGERLSVDARRCVCGWGAKKRGDEETKRHDMVCRWQYGNLTCRYPVGMFGQGEYRGLCIFHRQTEKGHAAAQIAQESQDTNREQYLEAASRLMYGKGDNPYVKRLRATLRKAPAGNMGELAKANVTVRQPGDEAW